MSNVGPTGQPSRDGLDALRFVVDVLDDEVDASTLDRASVESLFDDWGEVVLVLDKAGYIVRANLRAEEVLGYSREELFRMRLSDLIERPRR